MSAPELAGLIEDYRLQVERQQRRITTLLAALNEAEGYIKEQDCDDWYWCAAAKNGVKHPSAQICRRCAALASIRKAKEPKP